MKISLAMIVKNEEVNLKRCLDSVKHIVDEMVIVDTGSEDSTKTIANDIGAHVFEFTWNNDFSAARNYALEKCTGDWILVLDADEWLIGANKKQFIKFTEQKDKQIGRIAIISNYEENEEVFESTAYVSRFFPKGVLFEGIIHEQLKADLPRKIMDVLVKHDGYFKKDKTERNIPLLEEELKKNPNDSYFLYQIGKEYRNKKEYITAKNFFQQSYVNLSMQESYAKNVVIEYLNAIIKTDMFEDGLRLIKKEDIQMKSSADYHFAKGNFYLNFLSTKSNPTASDVQLIEHSFLKCLEIGESKKDDSTKGTGSFLASYNLGLLYELFGLTKKARYYYKESAKYNYKRAIEKLS